MDSSTFRRLVIVDSIPTGECNTARNLRDDLKIAAAAYAPTPQIEYLRVESAQDLLHFLSKCRDEVIAGRGTPMVHIECHGDEEGFGLADQSFIDWSDLKLPFTELNVATRLNLMIAVAACTGGALGKITSMGDRAPFWGLIGPTRTMLPTELEAPYRALYTTLFQTKSPEEAMKAMDAAAPPNSFWRTTAQGLFQNGWTGYEDQYCNATAMEARAQRLLKRLQSAHPGPYPSVEECKAVLAALKPSQYDRYVEIFFMLDLYPEHRQRFSGLIK